EAEVVPCPLVQVAHMTAGRGDLQLEAQVVALLLARLHVAHRAAQPVDGLRAVVGVQADHRVVAGGAVIAPEVPPAVLAVVGAVGAVVVATVVDHLVGRKPLTAGRAGRCATAAECPGRPAERVLREDPGVDLDLRARVALLHAVAARPPTVHLPHVPPTVTVVALHALHDLVHAPPLLCGGLSDGLLHPLLRLLVGDPAVDGRPQPLNAVGVAALAPLPRLPLQLDNAHVLGAGVARAPVVDLEVHALPPWYGEGRGG